MPPLAICDAQSYSLLLQTATAMSHFATKVYHGCKVRQPPKAETVFGNYFTCPRNRLGRLSVTGVRLW